ncbi:MAG: hypothetical protein ACRD1V_14360 [Vicinamibacterales bacterium]
MPRTGSKGLIDLTRLNCLRDRSLGLEPAPFLRTGNDAVRFLRRVGVALRYGAGAALPLASMYHAASGPDRDNAALVHAIEVTNHVLETANGIEVNVIADRLCLVDRAVMPFLYILVRRGRSGDDLAGLTLNARRAYQMIRDQRQTTAGRLRRHLGAPAGQKIDPAYEALSELQKALLVDRGPFEVRRSGVPYLSKEGYPYHLLEAVHPDLVDSAVSVPSAARGLLSAYLGGARFCSIAKLKTMFRLALRSEEIDEALSAMAASREVTRQGTGQSGVAILESVK